jgi:tRNA nucleotidyltransferase (CCA-adding enzyme)
MNCELLMRNRLPGEIYKLLKSICETGYEIKHTVFVVGGFVRDLLMNYPNLDVDIVVEGNGIAFAKAIAAKMSGHVTSHDRFGTAVVTFTDGFKIDIATARTEIYIHPGALPDVSFGSIKEDLYRRDFTINSMAIDLNAERFGELVDFFEGMSDLQNKNIKVLHDLSFIDDPTRMFRAIRFEQRLGFLIEPHTRMLMEKAISEDNLKNITGQRLRNEILLILKESRPLPAIIRMAQFDLMKYIHPAILISPELEELFHSVSNVLDWYPDQDKIDKVLLNFLILLYQLDTLEVEEVCNRLVLTNVYAESLKSSKTELLTAIQHIKSTDKPSLIYKNLKKFNLEVLLFSIVKFKETYESISLYLTKLRNIKSLISGSDLKKLGYPEGPLYTQILDKTFTAQLDGLIANKHDAIDFIKSQFPI